MSRTFKIAIIAGICLDCILIAVFVIWLRYSKNASEFNMLVQEMKKKEEMYNKLLNEMEKIQKGLPLEYSSDVVLSVSNIVFDKMEENLFPIEYTLDKGDVSGVIKGEKLSNFQFVEGGNIQFRMRIIGKNLAYNPRGKGIIDSMLSGMELKKKIILDGTGEISFVFNEEKQRLEMKYDMAGIDFKTGFPQFVEKMIKDRFTEELRNKPQYVEFNFKPIKVRLGDNVTWGHYHVKDVITQQNRLMAIADLRFTDTEKENGKK